MKYENGQIIMYDNGVIRGVGKIIGKAMREQASIGAMWIVSDMTANVPTDDYPFAAFVCADIHISSVD